MKRRKKRREKKRKEQKEEKEEKKRKRRRRRKRRNRKRRNTERGGGGEGQGGGGEKDMGKRGGAEETLRFSLGFERGRFIPPSPHTFVFPHIFACVASICHIFLSLSPRYYAPSPPFTFPTVP